MKKEIEQHLKNAFQELSPNRAEEIWNRPVERASGNEWYLDGVPVKKTRRRTGITVLSMLAACVVLCTAVYLYRNLYVQATVYLDVNPSVELQTNAKQKVVKAVAHNRDGEKILAGMDLERTDVDVALNAVLGSMVKQGYLSEAKHMILLSVEGKNQEKADAMCKRLEKEVDNCLQSLLGKGKVYAHSIQSDSDIEAQAKKYGITPGKVIFIQRILEENPQLDFAALAKMPMSELEKYVEDEDDDINDADERKEESEENFRENAEEETTERKEEVSEEPEEKEKEEETETEESEESETEESSEQEEDD